MKTQQESPFGNPRFLAALAITFISLFGWQYYMNKTYPPQVATTANTVTTQVDSHTPQVAKAATGAGFEGQQIKTNEKPAYSAQEFQFEDDKVAFTVTSDGLGLKTFIVKTYKDREGQYIKYEMQEPLFAAYINNKKIEFHATQINPTEFKGEANVDGKKIVRTLKYDNQKLAFASAFEFEAGTENIEIRTTQTKFVPKSGNFLMPSFEHQDFIYVAEGKAHVENISTLKAGENITKTTPVVSMASISTQYFTAAIVNKAEVAPVATKKVEGDLATLSIVYELKNTKVTELNQLFYVGAKKTEILNAIDPSLMEVMNYGMFAVISKLLMKLLTFLHGILGNWGLAIIAMTLLVRTALLPFNVMSFRSAQAMQKIKPQMDAVRVKFKDDPMRLNKETMALMKQHKANPLSGCLPMLIQIPIFFALWRAIGSSVELYQQPFFGWITDLSHHDTFFVLPILMGITMYLQQKLTPTTLDPMQAKILNFMPILFTLFMLTLPSGLTLYNFVSSLFGATQQYFLLRDNKRTAELKPA